MGIPRNARHAAIRGSGGGCGGLGKGAAAQKDADAGSGTRAPDDPGSAGVLLVSRTAQFAANAATNYGRMLIQMAYVFVLTPYIIARIGADDYGLWSLVISALGFLSLLDLGFGTGVVKYVAECHGSGDIHKRNRILSTLAAVYLAIAIASGVCIAVLSVLFNQLFGIPAAQHQKATALLWILAVRFVLLALPLGLFRNALFGEQKVYLINVIQVVSTVALAAGTWFALRQGYDVVALAWVNLAAMLIEYL